MLLNESPAFELPKHQRKKAGLACLIASVLYIATGVYSATKIVVKGRKSRPQQFRSGREDYYYNISSGWRIEMKLLLEDHWKQSEVDSDEAAGGLNQEGMRRRTEPFATQSDDGGDWSSAPKSKKGWFIREPATLAEMASLLPPPSAEAPHYSSRSGSNTGRWSEARRPPPLSY